jgi:hypothetical protein
MKRITSAALAGACLAIVLAFAAAATGREAETTITVRDLPHAVITAFKDAYPEAEIVAVTRQSRDNQFYYRIECRDGKQRRNLLYSADGEVVENKENLARSDLPAPVRQAMDEQCPGGALLLAQRIESGKEVTYLLRMNCGEYRVNLVVDASGKVLQTKRTSGRRAEKGQS